MCVYHIWVTLELGNQYTNETGERRNSNHSPNTNNKNNNHTLLSLTGMESLSLFNLFVTLRHFDRMKAVLLADAFPHFEHRPLTTRAMQKYTHTTLCMNLLLIASHGIIGWKEPFYATQSQHNSNAAPFHSFVLLAVMQLRESRAAEHRSKLRKKRYSTKTKTQLIR